MKEWILGICATGLITTVICFIMPQGKLGNMIKSIFSLFVMFAVLKPVLKFDYSDFNTDDLFVFNNITVQEEYINYIEDKKILQIKKDCQNIIETLGAKLSYINLLTEENVGDITVKGIEIKLENDELNSDKDHKYIIEQVKITLSDYLKIDKKAVVIYE